MAKTAATTKSSSKNIAQHSVESMTGFGEARAKFGNITLSCRLRSLNHRFLDVKLRLPRNDMLALDMATRKLLAERFKRGSIELTINLETAKDAPESLVNTKLAKAYWTSARALAKTLGGSKSSALSLDTLLRLPGVVGSGSDESILTIDENEILTKLVEPAIVALKRARQTEGTKLATHLREMIGQMQAHVEQITALEGPEKEKARQAMIDRASETIKLLNSISQTPNGSAEFAGRLREEAVFWIERRDFEEERMRLAMHLKSFRELLSGSSEVSGRKLEFIQQEILREINTLGTKAHSPAITSHTIELKATLERIREQLANVE